MTCRTTAFTCRAGSKERDVSENRNSAVVNFNGLCRPHRQDVG
jgi:hypothetical protein